MTGPEDNVPPPQRTADQLVGLIQAKLDHLRRRRRMRLGTAGAAAVSVLVVFAAVTMSQVGGSPSTVVHTTAPAAHPETSSSVAVPTTVAPSVGGGSSGTSGTSSSSVPVPTTASRGPTLTPTTVHRSVPGASTTTSTTVDNPPSCTPAEVVVTATTDKPAYEIREPIVVTTTIENVSDHVCFLPSGGRASLQDPSGREKNLQAVGVEAEFIDPDWNPGPSAAVTQSYTFTDRYCTTTCMPAAAGTYEAVVSWSIAFGGVPDPQATVSFQVTTSPTGARQAPAHS